jgi:hypothetical protein
LSGASKPLAAELTCLRDVEFPMMREEAHAPPVQGRFDVQTNANGLAQPSGSVDGQHGNVQLRPSRADGFGNHGCDLVESGCFCARNEERLAARLRTRAREQDAADQIVDVHHV